MGGRDNDRVGVWTEKRESGPLVLLMERMASQYTVVLFAALIALSVHAPVAMSQDSVPPGTETQSQIEREINDLKDRRKKLQEQEQSLSRTLRDQADRIASQRDAMDEQTKILQSQREMLEQQRRYIDRLRLQMEELSIPVVDQSGDRSDNNTDSKHTNSAPSGGENTSGSDRVPTQVGQAPPEKPVRPVQEVDIIERRGVLTHKGTLIVEPSITYSYSSVTRVALEGFTIIPAITIGAIDVREVDRNTLIAAVSARYGVTDHLEVGLRVPYVRRDDRTTTRPLAVSAEEDTIVNADGSGIGDVEMTLNYMFDQGRGDGPFYVGSLRVKSRTGTDPFESDVDAVTGLQTALPTGTGFWSVQPGISISVPSDPAVFYGNLGYTYNFERDIDAQRGRIKPGDAIGLGFGMAFALNPRASFSLGYSHNSVAGTEQNGQTLPGSDRLQVGSLLIGLSHRIGGRRNLNITVGAGLTDDAPDVQLSFRLPIAFSPFSAD